MDFSALKNKIINWPRFVINTIVRFILQVLCPNSVRAYVYKHFGYSVSRSSKTQVNDGVGIYDVDDLEPADILIFTSYNGGSTIGHVGLYIGNNQFIHANDEKTGVIITSLSYGHYPERLVCGRRIV